MAAPLVPIIIGLALVGGSGYVFNALFGDDDIAEKLAEAGFPDPSAADFEDPRFQEALETLTAEEQAAVVEQVRGQIPDPGAQGGLGGLDADLAAEEAARQSAATSGVAGTQPVGGIGEVPDSQQEPSGPSFEGHTFSKAPPSQATARGDQAVVRAFRGGDRVTNTFRTRGGPGEEPFDEDIPLVFPRRGRDRKAQPGYPSGVVPYLQALHGWATEEGRTVEGLYRQRFYRQESNRLSGELQARMRRDKGSMLPPDERRLREFYADEGTLVPWEDNAPLAFPEQLLLADRQTAADAAQQLERQPAGIAGGLGVRDGAAFDFALFADVQQQQPGDQTNPLASDAEAITSALADANPGMDPNTQNQIFNAFLGGGLNGEAPTQVQVRTANRQLTDLSNVHPADRVLFGHTSTQPASAFVVDEESVVTHLYSLTEKQVEQLQTELWKAGYFGEGIPTRGRPDEMTESALRAAIRESAGFVRAGRSVTLEDVIEARQERHAEELARSAAQSYGISPSSVNVSLDDPEALRELAERQGTETLGRAANETEVSRFITTVHAEQRQRAYARQQAQQAALSSWQPETPWDRPPPELVDPVMFEEVAVDPRGRIESFLEDQAPAEAGATQVARSYSDFLSIIGAGGAS